MTKEQTSKLIYTTVRYVIEVLTILGIVTAVSCTTVFTTTNKGRQQVTIENESKVSADSASINLK